MKVLRLGSSQDTPRFAAAGPSREDVIRAELGRLLGEEVRIVTRQIWPNERFPALFARWLAEEQPDLVTIPVIGYWFNFESVPLKLQRRYGRVGRYLGGVGKQAADVRWLSRSRALRAGRRAAQALIGGETYFTVPEVVECVSRCLREALRHEGIGLIVQGPFGGQGLAGTGRKALAREEARRQELNEALGEICDRLHVTFVRHDRNRREAGTAFSTDADGVHQDARGQEASALEWAGIIAGEVGRLRGDPLRGSRPA